MSKAKITAGACAGILLGILIDSICKRLYEPTTSIKAKFHLNQEHDNTAWLKDWHEPNEIEAALQKQGLGEVGRPANFEEYRKELYNKYGYDALLSDAISLQRTVPDARSTACWNITYLSKLPRAAIIIIFYNERLSVLLRTVHSILNRTPAELLQEIILVDDGSTWPDMLEDLEKYMQSHFADRDVKVKLIRQDSRTGIMSARMAGAQRASKKAEVLLFMDAHFEVGYNWLPPLLEPIAIDQKTCTCPIIDRIAYDSFSYRPNMPWRGFFDYNLNYRMQELRFEEYEQPAKNFKNYIMMGGAMAIGSEFFWQLGGFDEGMILWGGEQFEMSFKIWMCGGQLLDVPCSRMGHLFRDPTTQGNKIIYSDFNFVKKNYRRLLDVWVEADQRNYFFQRRPELKVADAGDLRAENRIRRRLGCKSFSWMLANVMPDLHDRFLPVEPADLASGLIQSALRPKFCLARANNSKVMLEECFTLDAGIAAHKHFQYTWRGELRVFGSKCLESNLNARIVSSYSCHYNFGNQKWYYDTVTQWLVRPYTKLCIMANFDEQRVQLAECDKENLNFKWIFSHMNQTEMERWNKKLNISFKF